MAEYVLLRIKDEDKARRLVELIEANPDISLLSPSQDDGSTIWATENVAHVTVVRTLGGLI